MAIQTSDEVISPEKLQRQADEALLVLGTIFLGFATPTEGGAMGSVGALIMAAAKRRLSLDLIRGADLDDAVVVLRSLHSDRLARLLFDFLWCERPSVGGASLGVTARRRGRLPDRHQPDRLLPRLLGEPKDQEED